MFEADTENTFSTFRRSYGTSRAERIEDAASVFCILKYKTAARNDTDYIFFIIVHIYFLYVAPGKQTNRTNRAEHTER